MVPLALRDDVSAERHFFQLLYPIMQQIIAFGCLSQ
jgi:hypothetical protein